MNTSNQLLLVDDDTAFLNLLSRILSKNSFMVTSAPNLEEAQAKINSHTFTHAVLDLNLKGESGLELLEKLKSQQPNCHVILLTGYASIATSVAAMKLGAADYLCKPAKPEDIISALSSQKTSPIIDETAINKTLSPKRIEWEHIQKTLMEHDGNISATARALNMHRRTLQRKLQKKPVQE